MTLFLSREGVKRDWCNKSNVFKEFVMTLQASTRVFHKKKANEFLIFVIFAVLFVDVRHILDNCGSQGFLLEEGTNIFKFFNL